MALGENPQPQDLLLDGDLTTLTAVDVEQQLSGQNENPDITVETEWNSTRGEIVVVKDTDSGETMLEIYPGEQGERIQIGMEDGKAVHVDLESLIDQILAY